VLCETAMTIRKKMNLILMASTAIPLCVVGILGYYHARKTLESLRMEDLRSIATLKAAQIEDFFSHHKKHITIAQQRPTLKKNAMLLAGFSGDFNSPAYEAIKAELDRALKTYQPVYDFINIMLVDADGGIVYVLNPSSAPELLGHSFPDLWRKSFNDKKDEIKFSDIFSDKFEANTVLQNNWFPGSRDECLAARPSKPQVYNNSWKDNVRPPSHIPVQLADMLQKLSA
jgi:hypothetical protein